MSENPKPIIDGVDRITRGDMAKQPDEHVPGAEDSAFADHRHPNTEPGAEEPSDNKYLAG